MRKVSLGLFIGLLLMACSHPGLAPEASLRIEARADSGGYQLTLLATPGAKVNARLKPALELEGGGVIRFDQAALTADSGYFAAPPIARLPGPARRLRGRLRVGICPVGEQLCRALVVLVDQPLPDY